jgi:hypothetical protein
MATVAAGPPEPLPAVAELAEEPDAAHWARVCAWVPGTGYCRSRDCGGSCIFRQRREAEADNVRRWRRLRRMFTRPRLR